MTHREFFTAADFIKAIEKAVAKKEISEAERKIFMRDMSEIVENINENSDEIDFVNTLNEGGNYSIETNTYRRVYNPNGTKSFEGWSSHGILYRGDDKPDLVKYRPDGSKLSENWSSEKRRENEPNKPDQIFYHTNGNISAKFWPQLPGQPEKLNEYDENGNFLG